jgi:hypothetical protein
MTNKQFITDAKQAGFFYSANRDEILLSAEVQIPLDAQLRIFDEIRRKRDKAEVARLRDALEFECGGRCNAEYNPCNAREALAQGEQNE